MAFPHFGCTVNHVKEPGVNAFVFGVHHALDRELDIIRLKLFPIVEFHAFAQMERVNQAVFADFPLLRQAGDQFRFAIDRNRFNQVIIDV